MIDFGYTINKDSQIDFDSNKRDLFIKILSREPSITLCINCGTCSATCTAGNFTEFNIRKIFTLLRRGEIADLKSQLNNCMLCGKCFIACPRAVNTRNIIRILGNELNKL